MFSFLKKLFQGSDSAKSATRTAGSGDPVHDLENFVDYVVKALVDYPEEVNVVTSASDETTTITVNCRKEDIGKVVGKKGKTIMAIRALVSGAAGRCQKRVSVEVAD